MKRPRLKTLPNRVQAPPQRLAPPPRVRQADRTLNTNSAEWKRLREIVLVRDAYTCQACKRVAVRKGEAHVDHKDGRHDNNALENLQVLCRECHSVKTAKEDGGFGLPRK